MHSSLAAVVSVCILGSVATACSAQGYPQHTLWSQATARVNPAASANLYSLDFLGVFRRQWLDIEGSPTTSTLSLAAPIYIVNSGAAFSYQRDGAGATDVTTLRGSLAYGLVRGEEFGVSVGAGVSYRTASLNGRELRTETGDYTGGVFDHQDNLLPLNTVSASGIGVDVGVEFSYRESRLGFAVQDVNQPAIDWQTAARTWPATYLAYATTVVPLAERLDLDAGVLAQSDATVTQVQVNALFWYDGNIGAGGAFRGYSANSVDAASVLLAWRPSGTVTLVYAYDYGLSGLSNAHSGSHEIGLRYEMANPIGKGKLPPVIFNPRL